MPVEMHSINNLKMMEVVEINTGVKLGFIKDLKIDCINYKVLSIILPSQKISWFNRDNFIELPWDRVRKIGVDVVLVECDDKFELNIG